MLNARKLFYNLKNQFFKLPSNINFIKDFQSIIEILIFSILISLCVTNYVKYFKLFITDSVISAIDNYLIAKNILKLNQHKNNIYERYIIYTLISISHIFFDVLSNNFVDISILVQFFTSPYFFNKIYIFQKIIHSMNKFTNFIFSNLTANIVSYMCSIYLSTDIEIKSEEIQMFVSNFKHITITLLKSLFMKLINSYTRIDVVFNDIASRSEITDIIKRKDWSKLFTQKVIKKIITDELVFKDAFYKDKKKMQMILVKYSFLYGLSYIMNNILIILISFIISGIDLYVNYPFYPNKKLYLFGISNLVGIIMYFFNINFNVALLVLDIHNIYYLFPKSILKIYNYLILFLYRIKIEYWNILNNSILIYLSCISDYFSLLMICILINSPISYMALFFAYTNGQNIHLMILYWIITLFFELKYNYHDVKNKRIFKVDEPTVFVTDQIKIIEDHPIKL